MEPVSAEGDVDGSGGRNRLWSTGVRRGCGPGTVVLVSLLSYSLAQLGCHNV
jgi:hypothetical protein